MGGLNTSLKMGIDVRRQNFWPTVLPFEGDRDEDGNDGPGAGHDGGMTGQRPPLLAYACLAASMALVGSYVGASRLLVAVLPVLTT